ncbi:response regulator transcription factor [Flavobacterium sp. H122]|uniref:response regulator transcription factor n=1 Tax=Flavobacterium sp. H122 TaxID=2529860 RepID=UPI0010AA186D|nr:response regulator transcription factor [Flavobacterium sp. H122]
MQSELKILIIDDHPMIIEAYKSAVNRVAANFQNIKFTIDTAGDCEAGDQKIKNCNSTKKYNIVFLDVKLPPSLNGKIVSGEDLGLKVRNKMPGTKIIVSTMFDDNHRIKSIFKNLNPEGFLIKSDVTTDILINAISAILNNQTYYSETVNQLLRKQLTSDFTLDDIDRQILYLISIGTKTKDLPEFLPLSIAGIERRKRNLKALLKIENNSNKELIKAAHEKGFI